MFPPDKDSGLCGLNLKALFFLNADKQGSLVSASHHLRGDWSHKSAVKLSEGEFQGRFGLGAALDHVRTKWWCESGDRKVFKALDDRCREIGMCSLEYYRMIPLNMLSLKSRALWFISAVLLFIGFMEL